MRVLMITQQVDVGAGVLGFTHTWVDKLAERVERLDVLALSIGRHRLRENVSLYSMGKEEGAGRVRRLAAFSRAMARLVLGRQVDVVFAHMCPMYAVLAAPWAWLAGVPVVLWYSHAHVSLMLRLAHALCARIVTSFAGSYGLGGVKVQVVGQGVDVEAFQATRWPGWNRQPRVVAVGRISPVKDLETLVDALPVVREMGWDVEVDLVGAVLDRAYFDRLQARVAELGLQDRVVFAGSVAHGSVAGCYQRADVFVDMQAGGYVNKAVLEAMACGVPCVVCCEGLREELGDFKAEVSFQPGDARDLAGKLVNVLGMGPQRRQELARLVRGIASRHSVDGLMDRLVQVFESV